MQSVTAALNSRVTRAGSLAAYCAVVIALTLLKSFYRIGYLWDPASQSRRGLSLVPLAELIDARSVFAPVFARWAGPQWFPLWVSLGVAAAIGFVGLVLAGERLGDPAKVREVY